MDESWKSPEMAEAERLLAEQADLVDQAIADARAVNSAIEVTPLTDREIADIDAAARAPEAPEELRRLTEKIGYGQLTWPEVFSERGMRHRDVRVALAELRLPGDELAMIESLAQAYQDGRSVAGTEPAAPEHPDESFEHHTFRL